MTASSRASQDFRANAPTASRARGFVSVDDSADDDAPAPQAAPTANRVQPIQIRPIEIRPVTPSQSEPPAQTTQEPPAPTPIAVRPVAPTEPAEPPKPAYPNCTTNPAEAKAMVKDLLGAEISNRPYRKVDGHSGFVVRSDRGNRFLMIDMFDNDGESLGTTGLRLCARGKNGITAYITTQNLNFGLLRGAVLGQLAQDQGGNSREYILDITKSRGGQVYVSDRLVTSRTRTMGYYEPGAIQ